MKQIQQAEYAQRVFKVILIGNPQVGKSQIISRFTTDTFKLNNKPTIGFQCSTTILNIQGKIIKLDIWDTMGQQRYKSVTKSFYKNALAAVLVYSITDPKSFEDLPSWLQRINENGKMLITLVGNKIDLQSERKVSTEQGKDFAQSHQTMFLQSSAKQNINIKNIFEVVGQQLINKVNQSQHILQLTKPVEQKSQILKKDKKQKKVKNNCC